ncbi:hypothetical protein J6590_042300 [Homalodisca vitripennis]|nr:hypothetical protein J6590_042300 [Homalodisca vitripennis]
MLKQEIAAQVMLRSDSSLIHAPVMYELSMCIAKLVCRKKMALFPPEWMNEDFLSQCLSDYHKHEVEIISFEVLPALASFTDNYCSEVFQVKILYKCKNEILRKPLIIKSQLRKSFVTKIFENIHIPEPIFYKDYLTEAVKISSELPVPYALYSPITEVIVLEDLKERGYKMANRMKRLDLNHCKLFVAASAVLHATSIAVHKTRPDLVESLGRTDSLYSSNKSNSSSQLMKRMLSNGLKCMADNMELYEEYKQYAVNVRRAANNVWDKLVQIHSPHEKWNVLQQVDPWTPNMMFKYDGSGNVIDIKLFDFQSLRFSHPMNSLIYFIWTSATHEVIESNLPELFDLYCKTFNEKLKELGCTEIMSYNELVESMDKFSLTIIVTAGVFDPLFGSSLRVDFEKVFSSDVFDGFNPLSEYYEDSHVHNNLKRTFEQLVTNKVFDHI